MGSSAMRAPMSERSWKLCTGSATLSRRKLLQTPGPKQPAGLVPGGVGAHLGLLSTLGGVRGRRDGTATTSSLVRCECTYRPCTYGPHEASRAHPGAAHGKHESTPCLAGASAWVGPTALRPLVPVPPLFLVGTGHRRTWRGAIVPSLTSVLAVATQSTHL